MIWVANYVSDLGYTFGYQPMTIISDPIINNEQVIELLPIEVTRYFLKLTNVTSKDYCSKSKMITSYRKLIINFNESTITLDFPLPFINIALIEHIEAFDILGIKYLGEKVLNNIVYNGYPLSVS